MCYFLNAGGSGISNMTFPCVMKVIRISLHIGISLQFSSFLCIICISLCFSAFLCISQHLSSFLNIYLHFSVFLCISLHFTAFLCISLHFSAFLCILHLNFRYCVSSSYGRHFFYPNPTSYQHQNYC